MNTIRFVYKGDPIKISHRILSESERNHRTFVWEETKQEPFDELIISWDAERPETGSYLIQVSLLTSRWSPWLDYAYWSAKNQYTFKVILDDIRVYQDAVESQHKATGFKVRIIAKDTLGGFRGLHTSAIDRSEHAVNFHPTKEISVNLRVPGISQIALPDDRRIRLCSPTSTTAVIHFLSNAMHLSPIDFANTVVDTKFDIYGNWILNTAQASHLLGKDWSCYVARLTTFDQIIDQLLLGYPVVVSIRGPLKGSALPYESGHLVVVTGFDSKTQAVSCMDPAFPSDEMTHVKYPLSEFLTAWSRRQGIAYLFSPQKMDAESEI